MKNNQQEKINTLVLSDNYKFWLGGFIEGEGSLTISIVENDKLKFGFALQPEFNIAQHISGIHILNSFKLLFGNLGSVHKKSGSENVWVYVLKVPFNIKSYIIPFYESYVLPYSSKYKSESFEQYQFIIDKLHANNKQSMNKDVFIELVKLTYKLNPEGKGKKRLRKLEEVIDSINTKN